MGHHHHAHDRHVRHAHTGLRLGRGAVPIHGIGRRRFRADLGRQTFAVAILGGVVAACSSDDIAAPARTGGLDDTGDADDTGDTADTSATTDPTPTTATGGAADAGDDTDGLRWAQANLG